MQRSTLFTVVVAAGLGCAASRPPLNEAPLRPLEQSRVQRAVDAALASRGLSASRGGRVHLAARRDVACVASVAGRRHCVAWVTAADRARLGSAIPTPSRGLTVAAGTDGDQGVSVLVLDAERNGYEPDPDRASADRPTVVEVEDRVTRAVIDWVTWLRGEGRL
ncbi:MAG: hypothetical protein R3A52_09320 [Polyangiales bacterium]